MSKKYSILSLFIFYLVAICIAVQPAMAEDNLLKVDVRHRPPEMVTDGASPSGPLLDVISEAAGKAGYQVKFQERQFRGSLEKLKTGDVDILPRTICTPERAQFIDFIGPIGYQEKDILFLVKSGKENTVQSFEDLKKVKVGVKKGTFYFAEFNNEPGIEKIESKDDENLVRMFAAGRFDVLAILDKNATEQALKQNNINGYAFAAYKHTNRIGNYFGIAPNHEAKAGLQSALEEMVRSGRVEAIYEKHGVTPPSFDPSLGFDKCE